MRRHTLLLTAALLPFTPLLTVAATPAKMPSVLLRYKFQPGQTLAYRFTVDGSGNTDVGAAGQGAAVPVTEHLEAVMRMKVQSVRASDGAATMQITYDSEQMTLNGEPLSDQDTQQVLPPATVVMTPAGKVLSYKTAPTSGPATTGMPTADMFLPQNEGQLPTGPVTVGQTWQETAGMAAMGLGLTASSELTGVDRTGAATLAHFTTTVNGAFNPSSPGAAGPAALQAGLAGTVTGTLAETFDVTFGATASETGHFNLAVTMTSQQAVDAGLAVSLKMQLQTRMTAISPNASSAAQRR